MTRRLTLAAALAALAATGCVRVASITFENPMAFSEVSADRLEDAARRTLMDLRFDLVYPEASEGHVTTQPMTGASWFEFWREDTRGQYQVAESSLQTTRRKASVSISPKDAGSQVFVKVVKFRKSAPDQMPQNIGSAFNIHDPEDTDLARQNELAPAEFDWVEMGRDGLLEQHILEQIQVRLK